MMTDCHITEYDGAFICWTHNRTWGAMPEPDEPCKEWQVQKRLQELHDDDQSIRDMHERITALTAELADRDRTIERLRAMIRRLEWAQYWPLIGETQEHYSCAICDAQEQYGHGSDCELAAVLKE
jgi:hypothetical protein